MWAACHFVLHRIVVNVIHVASVIIFAADHVVPETTLPRAALAASTARRTQTSLTAADCAVQSGETGLDGRPTHRKARIVLWKRPDAVQVVRQYDNAVNLERAAGMLLAKGGPKTLECLLARQQGPASVRHDREEERRSRSNRSTVFGHDTRTINEPAWCGKPHPTPLQG